MTSETPGRQVGDQIRRNARAFVALIAMITVALLVGGYILSNERLTFPGWVPLLGSDSYTLRGDFQTAPAVTPGQGQAVTIAGVKVGEISSVDLQNGLARVTTRLDRRYAPVYRDATMLLRPKTQLKDMTIELTKGHPSAGALSSGATLPVTQTAPDVNFDEVLASLDGDSRAYLQMLIGTAGQALAGQGSTLAADFKRFDPTARDLAQINGLLSQRHDNVSRVIHNLSLLFSALSTRDQQLSQLVSSSSTVLGTFARRSTAVQATVAQLPAALAETQTSLGRATQAANLIPPALGGLTPSAKALAPAERASQTLFRSTTVVLENQLRPFSRIAQPELRALAPAATSLNAATPDLTSAFGVLSEFLNELAYEPSAAQPGFLFYLDWANHNLNSLLSSGDAQGPTRQGLLLFNCPTLQLLQGVEKINPTVHLLLGLLNPPPVSTVCAGQTNTGIVTLSKRAATGARGG